MILASISKIPLGATMAALMLVAGCDRPAAETNRDAPSVARDTASAPELLPAGFVSATARVNGTSLHCVTGGQGPDLILIHGFPENWSAYAEIMPRLAVRFRVVAVDLRGIGGSTPTERGYDAATMAEDVHQLARALELNRPYVVGHDIGGRVTYAMARLHPDAMRGAMILDVPIAGIDPWDEVKANPALWHFGFYSAPGLAEKLLAGREALYFDYFLRMAVADPNSISDDDVQRYARAYALPGRMAAAMEMYRASAEDERFGREQRGALDVPIALVGGAAPNKGFGTLLPAIARGLRGAGARAVTTDVIAGSGHYVVDEKPAEVVALIERYASMDRSTNR